MQWNHTYSQLVFPVVLSVQCVCLSLLLFRLICAKLEHRRWRIQMLSLGSKAFTKKRRTVSGKTATLILWTVLGFVFPQKVDAMALLQTKRYIANVGSVIECIYVERDNENGLSTVTVLQHNLSPSKFAASLKLAACWFDDVAAGRIEHLPFRNLNTGNPKTTAASITNQFIPATCYRK